METGITYVATSFFGNSTAEALCEELIIGTNRQMARVYLTGSGMVYYLLSGCERRMLTQSRLRGYGSYDQAISTVLL
jgi:hypothetical protein